MTMPKDKNSIVDDEPATTAEDATLGPPEVDGEVVLTGPEPDVVIPGRDSDEELLSEPRAVPPPGDGDERGV